MASNRWLDRTQPQTLYIAVILLYITAAFQLIGGYLTYAFPFGAALVVGQVGAGFGIANEKKWGYWLGLVMAVLPLVLVIVRGGAIGLIGLMFQVALIALLLHPQSREYRRIWFK
jgi:hypothetical protein